jgi:hypothetical protein
VARKRQQYRRPPRPAIAPNDERSAEILNQVAAQLTSSYTLPELEALLSQSQEAKEWADQHAQLQPGPEALGQFRAAAQRLAELERALALTRDVARDRR